MKETETNFIFEVIEEAPPVKPNKKIIKEYELKGTANQLYNLKIFHGDKSLLFIVKIIDDLRNVIYKKELTLAQFYNITNYFRQFMTCEEIFSIIFWNLKISDIYICKENDNIKLGFQVGPLSKKEIITFLLIPEEGIIDNIIWNLCERVKIIEEKNEINERLLSEINIFRKKIEKEIQKEEPLNLKKVKKNKSFVFCCIKFINKYKISILIFLLSFFIGLFFMHKLKIKDKYISDLKNEINEIKIYLNDLKYSNNLKQKKNRKIYNGIIKPEELDLIEKEMKNRYNKNIIDYKLLFRASRDGYEAENFHKKCDGKGNTLTLVKTKSGRRFGGYTEAKWDSNSGYINLRKGFVFSIDNKEIYYNEKRNYNIYCNMSIGPSFRSGPHDFTISDKCNINNKSFEYIRSSSGNYILEGNEFFRIKDYEIYALEME